MGTKELDKKLREYSIESVDEYMKNLLEGLNKLLVYKALVKLR